MSLEIGLGMEVEDKITGFKGVITGYAQYITGCTQYLVQPPVGKEGTWVESQWFDEGRLKLLEYQSRLFIVDNVQGVDPGPDKPAPKR